MNLQIDQSNPIWRTEKKKEEGKDNSRTRAAMSQGSVVQIKSSAYMSLEFQKERREQGKKNYLKKQYAKMSKVWSKTLETKEV